jgi:LEA14-like dessication related protein
MRWKIPFPVLGLALGLLMSCNEIRDPEFRRIENFSLKNFGLTQATVGFRVTYFNPNNFGVNVKEAEADVFMDSVYLGKFTQDSLVNVQKDAEFSIPFSGNIPFQKALGLNLQNLASRNILLKADGSVKVGKAGVYITRPIKYQGVHRLDEIKISP